MKTNIFVLAMLAVLVLNSCTSLRIKYSKQVTIVEKIMNDETFLGKIRNDTNYVNVKSFFFIKMNDTIFNEISQKWFEGNFQIINVEETTYKYTPDDADYSTYGDHVEGVMITVKANKNANIANFHFFNFGEKYLLDFIETNTGSTY